MSLHRPNAHLVFRFPTQYQLLEPCALTPTIELRPGAKYEPPAEDPMKFFGCTILYIEHNPKPEQHGPPTFPPVVSYEELREFIAFWSFLMQEDLIIQEFE